MERAIRDRSKSNFLVLLLLSVFLLTALPATSFAKQHDRRHRRDADNWKCGKFVNCHDARDGRVDGRGPRRDNFSTRDRRSNWRNDNWRDRNWQDRNGRDRNWRDRNWDNQWRPTRYAERRWNGWDDDRRWRNTTYRRSSRWDR